METVLIVDDEKNYLLVLEDLLIDEGYRVLTAGSGLEAIKVLEGETPDVVVTDMKMPGKDGMALLEDIHAEDSDLPVVMMTAYGTIEKAVEAMKKGAYDYILKPFKNEELKLTIRKAIEHHRLIRQNRHLTRELQERYQFHNIIGKSPVMQRIYRLIEKVAPTRATVLITGESGTGKELIARAIHYNSPRRERPFISVNCGALPENLLESELFGHERGAFSGAVSRRQGRFELADGGTLFLDEIGETSPSLQVKLLRVLQEMEFERVGGSETLKVDVRVVAASNRRLKDEVAAGEFRSDLFYRLNVVQITLPPLRERTEDISLLVNHFLRKYTGVSTGEAVGIRPEAMRRLLEYPWPGNVRELENVIERSMILASGDEITEQDLPYEVKHPESLPESYEDSEDGMGTEEWEHEEAEDVPALDDGLRLPETGLRPRQLKAVNFVRSHGYITNKYYSELADISERQALRELNELVEAQALIRVGKGRGVRYVLSPNGSESAGA